MTEPPVITHLGKVRGQWPVFAFTSELHAAQWATERRALHEVRHVWAVEAITLGDPLLGEVVPEQRVLALEVNS